MAKGIKTGGRDIQPGQILNPKGGTKLTPELKDARALCKTKFDLILPKYLDCNAEELNKHLKDKKTSALDLIVISALISAIKKGDSRARDFIIDRAIGGIKKEVEVSSPSGHTQLIAFLSKKNEE